MSSLTQVAGSFNGRVGERQLAFICLTTDYQAPARQAKPETGEEKALIVNTLCVGGGCMY